MSSEGVAWQTEESKSSIAISWKLDAVEEILECTQSGIIAYNLFKETPSSNSFPGCSIYKTKVSWSSK